MRGTVRDLNSEKTKHLLKLAEFEPYKDMDLVEMDLNEHYTIPEALKGSTYLVHTAVSMEPDPTADGPLYQEEVMK